MRVPSADGEVTTSHNFGPGEAIDERALSNVLRVCQAEYNRAAADKREAIGVMRDEKRAFQKGHAEAYEAIQSILNAAREDLKGRLRNSESYARAEEDKRDAALRMKAVVKKLKSQGVDVPAFKQALKMAELDIVERQEHFDNIDIYCKVLRLWNGADI